MTRVIVRDRRRCPVCGGPLIRRGFLGHNRRVECRECGLPVCIDWPQGMSA